MTVETLSALERRLSLNVNRADIAQAVEVQLKRVAKTAKMAGFRQGKVPMNMVAQQYGYQVEMDVVNEKVGEAFEKAVEENKLRVAGAPRLEAQTSDNAPDGVLGFNATFEVYPDVVVGDLSKAEVKKTVALVSEAEIDKTIEILRKQRTHFHSKAMEHEHGTAPNQVAEKGDQVTIDFVGTLDGVEFAGGKAEDFGFVIGEGRMLPEFEAATMGLKAGDTKTFPMTFPEDYHGKDVAGKSVEFKITVKNVEWPHSPEVNADFAKMLGVADGDISKMRADIKANLEREVKRRTDAQTKNSVMDALLAQSQFDVPKVMIESDSLRLAENAKADFAQRGMDVSKLPAIPPETFAPQAERRVRLGLILAELVKAQNLTATPDTIRAQVDLMAASYERPADVVKWYYADRKRLGEVEALVLEENVVTYVLSKARVTDVAVPFEELMQSQN